MFGSSIPILFDKISRFIITATDLIHLFTTTQIIYFVDYGVLDIDLQQLYPQ